MSDKPKMQRSKFLITVRDPRLYTEVAWERVLVDGWELGQFGVAKLPGSDNWTVTHLKTGTGMTNGGIKKKKDAVELLYIIHCIVGDTDLFTSPPPMNVINEMRAAVREWGN